MFPRDSENSETDQFILEASDEAITLAAGTGFCEESPLEAGAYARHVGEVEGGSREGVQVGRAMMSIVPEPNYWL